VENGFINIIKMEKEKQEYEDEHEYCKYCSWPIEDCDCISEDKENKHDDIVKAAHDFIDVEIKPTNELEAWNCMTSYIAGFTVAFNLHNTIKINWEEVYEQANHRDRESFDKYIKSINKIKSILRCYICCNETDVLNHGKCKICYEKYGA